MRPVSVRLSGLTLNGYLDERASAFRVGRTVTVVAATVCRLRGNSALFLPGIRRFNHWVLDLWVSWKGRGLSDRILEGSATSASQA
jgi:hypothetical protein